MELDTFDLTQLNIVDVVIAVYLIYGAVRGVRRGLSGELARLFSLAVAIVAGWQFYEPLGEQLAAYTRLTGAAASIAGFFCTVLAAGAVLLVLRLMLKNIMEFAFKGKIERLGGLLAGVIRAFCIASLALIAVAFVPVPYLQEQVRKESRVGSAILRVVFPLYQDVAVGHPEWGLPALPEGDPALASPAQEPAPGHPPENRRHDQQGRH